MAAKDDKGYKMTKLVLLKGGKSGEREISLLSGDACAAALRRRGFNVVEIDPAEQGFTKKIEST